MAGPDPVDVRLLSVLAELGNATVPDLAGRLGMDVRDVAARLAALSSTGLPLNITIECDQRGLRDAVAQAQAWSVLGGTPPPPSHPAGPGNPTGPPHGPSGPHPAPPGSGPQPLPPAQSSGAHQPGQPGPAQQPGTAYSGPHQQPPGPPNPAHAWGPPAGSAGWTRGEPAQPAPGRPGWSGPIDSGHNAVPAVQRPASATPGEPTPDPLALERTRPAMQPRRGAIGTKLDVAGPGGERLTIQLIEVVDPADYLFSAAGHELGSGQRAVVVHVELTNHGTAPYEAVPDEHLVLVADDGTTVPKSDTTLASRPPHAAGVHPGATAGGHTVYVLSDTTELTAVRWSPTAEQSWWTLTWNIIER